MSQDELYQWIADQDCQNVPPDESPADQLMAKVIDRLERGSWKWLKAQLEVDDDQATD